MIQGFLVALVAALVYMESRIGGQHMLDRPIIIGPLVGVILGDPVTGLMVGGSLELVWMGRWYWNIHTTGCSSWFRIGYGIGHQDRSNL